MTAEFRALVPYLHVLDMARSLDFYARLGFRVGNSLTIEPGKPPVWAWLDSAGAHLMLARASGPIDPEAQAAMLYLYCDDVPATHAALQAAGVQVGPIQPRSYSPQGEFRVVDPDGYSLMVIRV